MPAVGPQTSTIVSIVYDTDSGGFGGPADMTGPAIGNLSYRQDSADDLNLAFAIDFGQPNTVYTVFLTCGPAHALACGFRAVGTVSTNAVGQGNATLTVPFSVLHSPPFGPGYRTDHVDLLEAAGGFSKGVLTAGALNYFVCTQRVGHPPAELAEEERQAMTGDPLGVPPADRDPITTPPAG